MSVSSGRWRLNDWTPDIGTEGETVDVWQSGDDGEGADAEPVSVVRALGSKIACREEHLAGNIGVGGDRSRVVGLAAAGNAGEIPAPAAGTRHAKALPAIGGSSGGSV